MPAARKLKVFRATAGFYDAYVAAPSQKAALAAWGADKNLFAMGSAEQVTDPALMSEPLQSPGKVIKRSRGGLADQIAALPKEKPKARAAPRTAPTPAAKSPVRKAKRKPRPRRDALDRAEAALRRFEEAAKGQLAELRQREERLQQETREAQQRLGDSRAKLERQLADARESYEAAMRDWQG